CSVVHVGTMKAPLGRNRPPLWWILTKFDWHPDRLVISLTGFPAHRALDGYGARPARGTAWPRRAVGPARRAGWHVLRSADVPADRRGEDPPTSTRQAMFRNLAEDR